MGWIKTVLSEVYGLFVDDVTFAVAILAWVVVVWLVLPHVGVAPHWNAAALFIGLCVIFVESATRRAGQ